MLLQEKIFLAKEISGIFDETINTHTLKSAQT